MALRYLMESALVVMCEIRMLYREELQYILQMIVFFFKVLIKYQVFASIGRRQRLELLSWSLYRSQDPSWSF